jgi:glycosyltransferase involved in cell wall biosynthesis
VKILHLLASPFFTGPADAVSQLALAQRALGHEVFIAVDRKRALTTSEELIVPRLEAMQLLSPAELELSVKSSPLTMLRDVMVLRGLSLDVVHSHFSHDHTLARLGRPPRSTLIRSLHAPRSVRWTMPAADGFTVPMHSLGRKLLGKRVLVLPALVDAAFTPAPDRATLRASLGLPTQGRLLGMVSTFQPSRRHQLGLEAFAARLHREPSANFVLVGDGGLAPTLREQARSLGSSVQFVGYQSGAAFIRYLQALDEVWILGLGNDWSARAAAQARACGVRVVCVDEGDLARYADELVEPTVESLLAGSESDARCDVTLEAPQSIAARVLQFYERHA